jgi:hypothetical protein
MPVLPNPAVKTYDPKEVVITFGSIPISGYAEGTFVRVNRSGDAFAKSKGAGGDIERVNRNQGDFEVTITLQQTASSNTELSAILAADMATNAGVFPLTIEDKLGNTLFFAPQAWIRKDPEWEDGDELNSREWTFDTGIASNLVGGY